MEEATLKSLFDVSKVTNVVALRNMVVTLAESLYDVRGLLTQQQKENEITKDLFSRLEAKFTTFWKRFVKKGSESKKSSGKRLRRKRKNIVHNQHPLGNEVPENIEKNPLILSVEEVVHTEFEQCCESPQYEQINSFEESSETDVEKVKYKVNIHKRAKCICQNCHKILTAKGPAKLVPSGEFSIRLAAEVATDKFEHHIPLNRQQQIMTKNGLSLDTKTLFSLTSHLRNLLIKVPLMIKKEILSQAFVHADESPMKVLSTNENGFVWSVSNHFGTYFQYEFTRSAKVAAELLKGYEGVVVTDGYSGYSFIDKEDSMTRVLCWAHVRRKFHDALKKHPVAAEVIEMIDELYVVEHEAPDFDTLKVLRKAKSKPILDNILGWAKTKEGSYLETSLLGVAISYLQKNTSHLSHFFENPCVPIDNNRAERAQRGPVMGRKNYFGFRTINGADVAMDLYTIIHSCKILSVNPSLYLNEMAKRSATGMEIETPFQFVKNLRQTSAPPNIH